MTHITALWLFFLLVAGIVALPGLDMTFVLASSLTGGRRGGFAAIAGIVAGGIGHVAVGTLGTCLILHVMLMPVKVLLLGGFFFVGWIGWSTFRRSMALDPAAKAGRSWLAACRRGALTNLLNPK